MLSDVTIGLLRADFIYDAVLYAIKVTACFYKVQYEHIKQDVVGYVFVFCFKFLWAMFLPRIR